MFLRNPPIETHPLDETITKLISKLEGMEAGSEEYSKAVVSLQTLMELRAAEQAVAKQHLVSPEKIADIAANLLGISLILGFEKANVVTSKGLGFVPRIKI